jgi:heptosyltransferase-2
LNHKISIQQPLPPEALRRFRELQVKGRLSLDSAGVRAILVRAPNWVGDAVMSLPVLHGLGGLFPSASITVLAVPRVAPLFPGQPGVVEIIPYPPGLEKWRRLRALRGRFDLALALPNSLESALGLWLAGAPVRVGYNADLRGPFLTASVAGRKRLKGLHQVFYYLGLLTALGSVESFIPPTLRPAPEEIAAAGKILNDGAVSVPGPWVGLSPGAAYGPAKRWPPERFAALAGALQEEFQAGIVLLGGPDDREAADRVKASMPRAPKDLTGRTTLRQALGVLANLKLLVTNDSGLMHAAAALGTPLVALFGSTDPVATGPFTSQATVIHHPRDCAPCLKRTCPTDYECLTDITVAEVLAAARAWLSEAA